MASLRAQPRNLFDFNWFNQSFPAICLRCLSAPVALVTNPRFPGRPSWPVEPPGVDELRHLEHWLKSRLDSWKKRRRPLGGDSHHKTNGANGHAIHPQPTQEVDEGKEYMNHLLSVYQTWKSLSEEQKQQDWRLECQKALAREQEAHNSTTARLEMVEQQLRHLRAQLDQGRNHQQSTELLSQDALDELNNDVVVSSWDPESAILKWKTRIRNVRNDVRNIQQPLPNAPISKPLWSQTVVAKPLTNGAAPPMQAPPMQPHRSDQRVHQNDAPDLEHEPPDEVDNDEDLVDAPGDDDDEGSVHCHSMPDRVVDGQAVVDPDLVDHIDTVMKGTTSGTREASGEGFASGPLLPGLQVEYMKM